MIRKIRPALPALGAALLLAACAGVPLSTMWKLHGFGPADFSALDAAYLRTAVRLPGDIDLKDDVTVLKLDFTRNDDQEEHRVLPLRRIAEGRQVDPGLEDAGEGRHWLLFTLTDQGIEVFRELQQSLRAHQDAYKAVTVTVKLGFTDEANARLSKMPELPFSIWQRLKPQDGFIELYTGALAVTGDKNDK